MRHHEVMAKQVAAGGPGSSRWSLWSQDSFLSIGSRGSVLSIGSVGSALSVGSVGSFASLFSAGSAFSVLSLLSARSCLAVMSYRSVGGDRDGERAVAGRATGISALTSRGRRMRCGRRSPARRR
jgi:hypothetical protein